MTSLQSVFTPTRTPSPLSKHVLGGLLATAAVTALISSSAFPAFAAPGDESTDTVVANIGISSAIALTGLTPSFTINAPINATTEAQDAVSYNVNTNNAGGYNVTVSSRSATLAPDNAATGNTDSIPIEDLKVRVGNVTSTTYLPVTETPVEISNKASRSAAAGDAITNDYEITVGFVADGTYSATLDYVATAN
jgi:hypothetical protein